MKNKSIGHKLLKVLKYFTLTLIVIVVGSLILVNITPRPISFIAKKLIFDPTPMKFSPDNFDTYLEAVTITSDLEYVSDTSNNRFDVYSPKQADSKTPVIIWIHGGGFIGGDKTMVSDYATILASEGYTVIAMNYALAPKAKYPSPVNQTHELVKHLYNQQDTLNLDMEQIIFAGDSAGAHIASQYVMTQTDPTYSEQLSIEKIIPQGDIKAMLLYCGPYRIEDLTQSSNKIIRALFNQLGWAYLGDKNWSQSDLLPEASIIDNVTSAFPPSYITDGNTASFQASGETLAKTLTELGVPNQTRFYDIEDGTLIHEFQFNLQTKEGLAVLEDTITFINERIK